MTDQEETLGVGAIVRGMVREVANRLAYVVDDLVERDTRAQIIVDVGQRDPRLDEQRRDKAVVAFVQDTPVAAVEEEDERRCPSGRRYRAMQIEGLLRSDAIAQVVDAWEALACCRRAGGVPLQGNVIVPPLFIAPRA